MTQLVLGKIREVILRGSEFVLLCHVDPDGDAIGSLLGLGLSLRAAGNRVRMISPDGVPANYTFLPEAGRIEKELGEVSQGTVVIALDCADLGRLGPAGAVVEGLPLLVNIDHHPTNSGFGRFNLVDARAAATAELVYFLQEQLNLPLSLEAATCLYTGIHTDTGGFRYENTTARAHAVAQKLLEAGVRPAEVADYVYDMKPLPELLLLREALNRLKVSADGALAWVSLSRELFAACGTEETGGLINYPRMLAGVEIAMLFKEAADGKVRVGFRSRRVDVSRLAVRFGGGGHARAAGCSVPGPLAQAEERVLAAAEAALREVRGNG